MKSTIRQTVHKMSGLGEDELRRLLDPAALTRGGLHGGGGQG